MRAVFLNVSNFSEIPCVKIGFNVNDFLRMMNESRFPECGRFLDFTSTCGDSLFVIQKSKLLHMNTVVNIAPPGVVFPWQSDRYARRIFRV